MKVALTGATGFIGSHTLRDLQDHGHEVMALVGDDTQADGVRDRGANPGSARLFAALRLGKLMSEQRPESTPRPPDPAGRRPSAPRAADRHYVAVVAAEARRLARELRPRSGVRASSAIAKEIRKQNVEWAGLAPLDPRGVSVGTQRPAEVRQEAVKS